MTASVRFGTTRVGEVTLFQAKPNDLDGEGDRRAHAVTDHLLDILSLKALWDEYGIVGDLLVRYVHLICFTLPEANGHTVAIHCRLSACRYS